MPQNMTRIYKGIVLLGCVIIFTRVRVPPGAPAGVTPARTAAFGKLAEGGYFYETAG